MADHLAAQTPLEEHRKLAVFAGEWVGDETVFPSRWNAGGPATSKVSARIDLNGFYLIQDTRQTRDGKESFATHGVFTYDRDDRPFRFHPLARLTIVGRRHSRLPRLGPWNGRIPSRMLLRTR